MGPAYVYINQGYYLEVCLFIFAFLQMRIMKNYSKKSVMERALPVAVKFLHKGNKELSRNMASYLSLAAIEHASLLSPHVQPIMDSIISGIFLLQTFIL